MCRQKKMSLGQERKPLIEANKKMACLLELSERGFKVTIINMVQGL